ncbi:DUF2637 domain-containing protein [Streptomyces sp. NBC_00102]|uniref:DUF2637 domain-containing protein n=1 Tax=Streptomyces sp. NBC_00102 TaxID=2975652 RepID=UPI0022562AF3|nr:DUF2637 domain-containing protein [Streptomyces sp. NBC_00102]MCX5397070.1 DUF2637 domain-containing protein [Streptomyces sp. NBC_00102]
MGARPRLRIDAVLIQAMIAGALSFAHLHDLAAAAGQDGWKAWAYPVSVDLLLVAAWRRLRAEGPSRLAWCWFLVALVASLGANIATAGFLDLADPPAPLRLGIAGWPALAFLGGTLLAHSATDRAPVMPAAATDPVTVETTVDSDPVPPADAVPLPVPDDEASAPPVQPSPVPPVPAALVDHARKVADEHRDRTGSPIDTDTLRSRLGVPPHLAAAIAAHLA